MDKEKAKALSKTLACYKELQENNGSPAKFRV